MTGIDEKTKQAMVDIIVANPYEEFPTVEVNFSDEEIRSAIIGFVNRKDFGFEEASVYQFNVLLEQGVNFDECCRNLLLNEVCIRAITEMTKKD